jgi:hypothetical protein
MFKTFKEFITEEDGLGTVEIIVIAAVLVGVALLFRKAVWSWVNNMLASLLPEEGNFDNRTNVIETMQ